MVKNPKILILSGSIRSGSINSKLADAYLAELQNQECEATRINLKDYALPLYNGDDEEENGIPKNAEKLANLFHAHDGLVIVGPEYNGSLTPLLKNTIDWISRVKTVNGKDVLPFKGKVTAIAACSPGAMGGISVLSHMRDIFSRIGMLVISEQIGVGNGMNAFDDMGRLTNERVSNMFKGQCNSLVEKTTLLS